MKQVAAAAAIALALMSAYFLLRMDQEQDRAAEAAAKSIVDLEPAAVERIALQRREERPRRIVLERIAGEDAWRLAVPGPHRADGAAVQRLLDMLGGATYEGRFDGDPELVAGAGLEGTAAYAVTLETATATTTLRIGGTTPVDEHRYVRLAGDPQIMTAKLDFLYLLRQDAEEWRSRKVVHDWPAPVTYARFVSGAGSWSLVRDGDTWLREGEVVENAGVSGLLERIETLTVSDFVDADAATLGMAPPPRRIVVAGQEGRLDLGLGHAGAPQPSTAYVRLPGSGELATISTYMYEKLWPARSELTPPPATAAAPGTAAVEATAPSTGMPAPE